MKKNIKKIIKKNNKNKKKRYKNIRKLLITLSKEELSFFLGTLGTSIFNKDGVELLKSLDILKALGFALIDLINDNGDEVEG